MYILAYYRTKDYNIELFNCVTTYDFCDSEILTVENTVNILECFPKISQKIKRESENNKILIFRNYLRLFFDNVRHFNFNKIKQIYKDIEFTQSYIPQVYKILNCD